MNHKIMPRYAIIAAQLRDDISRGIYQLGEKLPTETQLAEQFAVNRHTLRQAVALLRNEGFVRVDIGRGTFVTAKPIRYAIGKRVRYNQSLKGQGLRTQFKTLRALQISADVAVAKALEINIGEPVALVERLGIVDDIVVSIDTEPNSHPTQAISITTGYFPLNRFPDFLAPENLEILQTQQSVSAFLQHVYGCDHIRRSTCISARLVQRQDAYHLQVSLNQPILLAESINVDDQGDVIEYGVTRFRGDRMELFFENDLTK